MHGVESEEGAAREVGGDGPLAVGAGEGGDRPQHNHVIQMPRGRCDGKKSQQQ